MKEGQIEEGIYSDGTAIFVTCPMCGYEQGDCGNDIKCEECGELVPSAQNLDQKTRDEWEIDDEKGY